VIRQHLDKHACGVGGWATVHRGCEHVYGTSVSRVGGLQLHFWVVSRLRQSLKTQDAGDREKRKNPFHENLLQYL
jgi:hypothetical protein